MKHAATFAPASAPRALAHAFFLAVTLLLAGCAMRPAAEAMQAPAAGGIGTPPADWRVHAGQRVRLTAPPVVSGNHRLGRDGTVVAAFGQRLRAPTEVASPGAAAAAVAAANRARSLALVLPPLAAAHPRTWRAGGVLESAEGTLEIGDHGPR